MRIALIVKGGLHPSGTEQVIPSLLWLVERLAREHDVHVFALQHLASPQTYPLGGATIHDLGRPGGRWLQWGALQGLVDEYGPFDVIHGYWIDPAGLFASLLGKRLQIPSVVTCDSGEFVSLPTIGYGLQRRAATRAIVSLTCRWATRVHVTSRYMLELARCARVDAVRIPIGVDVQTIGPPVERHEGPPWRLLQVASLNPVKDQSTLLHALALARRTHDVRLDLVGEDTMGGRLQHEAAALDLREAVMFHGFVPQSALRRFRDAAHVYVQSSAHEAAGVSVLEAAAAGLPIVGTRVGYVNDWDDEAAVAVAPRDAEGLARAIVDLLDRPSRRAELAERARAFAMQHNADVTAQAILSLYDSLAAAPR